MKPLKCGKNNVCNIFRTVVLFGVRKMLQTLFLQHFNGFILHGTFVVYQEIYIIFSKIKFFPSEYCYCFVVTASALPETASIYG